ncbi:sulfurtransferase TusA family protein [Peribacillus frigoritolerans]|nr:sulfurtransferase TusA family protein [Peribacillus frigoritolerans]MDM5306808.1 sulfurtransferase TusA family protein [Peribacillus frigoritolerans]
MPIVKTKKARDKTDKGAKSDLTAWAKSTGHVLIDLKKKTIHLSFST